MSHAAPPPRLRVRPHAPLPSRPLLIPLVGEAAASLAALRASIHAALFGEGLPAHSQALHVADSQLVLRLDDFEICGRPSEVLRDGDLIDVHALLQLHAPDVRPISAVPSALGIKSEAASRSGGSRGATPGKRMRELDDDGNAGSGQGSGRTRRRNAQRRLKRRDGQLQSESGLLHDEAESTSSHGDDDWEDAEAAAWDDEEDGMEWDAEDGLAGGVLTGEDGGEDELDGADGGDVSDEDDVGALGQMAPPDADDELLLEAQKIADKMRRRFGAGADVQSSDEDGEEGSAAPEAIEDLPRMDSVAKPLMPAPARAAMPLPPAGILAPPLKYGFQPASGLLARGGPDTGAAAAMRAFEERKRAMLRAPAPAAQAPPSVSSSSSSSSSSASSSGSSSSSSSSSSRSSKLPEREVTHVAAVPKPNVLPGAGSARTRRKNASRRAKEKAREEARRAAEFEEIRLRVLENATNGKEASDSSSTSDDSSDSSDSSEDTSSDEEGAVADDAAKPAFSISHAPAPAALVEQRTVAEAPPLALPPGGGLLGLPQAEKPSALEDIAMRLLDRPRKRAGVRPSGAEHAPTQSSTAAVQGSPASSATSAAAVATPAAAPAVATLAAVQSPARRAPPVATSSAAQSPARRAPPPPSTLAKVPPQVRVRALDCATWYDAAWNEGWPQHWYEAGQGSAKSGGDGDDAAQQSWSALQARARGEREPEQSVVVAATPEDLAAEALRAQLGLPRSFGNAETYVLHEASPAPESEPEEGQASSSHAASPSPAGSPTWAQPLARLPAWPFKSGQPTTGATTTAAPATAVPPPSSASAATATAYASRASAAAPALEAATAAPASRAITAAPAQPPRAAHAAGKAPNGAPGGKSMSPTLARFGPVRSPLVGKAAAQSDAAAHQSDAAASTGLDYSSPSPPPSRPPPAAAALPPKLPAPLVIAPASAGLPAVHDALVQARLAALASRRGRG